MIDGTDLGGGGTQGGRAQGRGTQGGGQLRRGGEHSTCWFILIYFSMHYILMLKSRGAYEPKQTE